MAPRMTRRRFVCGSVAGAAACSLCRNTGWADDSNTAGAVAVEAGTESHLFLDDWILAESHGLTKTLHSPVKKGLIREADGSDWQRGEQVSVVRDSRGGFQMVYNFLWEDASVRDLSPNIGDDKAHWFRRTYAYAQSQDGLHWQKPVLGTTLGPTGFRPAPREKWADGIFREPIGVSKENNLGCPIASIQDLATFGGVSDPGRRYLVNVLERSDTHNWATVTDGGLYFAGDVPDLVNDPAWRTRMTPIWQGARRGPRGELTRASGFDSQEKLWFYCCQSRLGGWQKRGGRDIARYASKDLTNWSAEELVLPIAADESRKPDDWVEYMDISVFRAGDLWIGQLDVFHSDRSRPDYQAPNLEGVWRKGVTDLRLICSRDAGKTWQPVGGRQVWIPHHAEENGFDRLVFPGSPVRVNDELWLYYNAFDGDHLVWNRDGTTYYPDRTRIGRTALATLRWDGFLSLDAQETPGTFLTRPLLCGDGKIEVNADASRGWLKVEVADEKGQPIPGFTLAECIPTTGNGTALPVAWQSKQSLAEIARRPVRLRIQCCQASLYAFRVA